MHWISVAVLCTLAIGQNQTKAKPAVPDFKAIPKKIELTEGTSIVLLGDSITHQCLYTQYVEDYIYARYPKLKIRVHNSGVGGDRCADALIRFDDDVAKYKPKYVTILLGMNDGGYRGFDQKIFDTYQRDMMKLVERIQGIGATPILMTPTMFDHRAALMRGANGNVYYNGTLAYFGSFLRETALAKGFRFVDMYGPLNTVTFNQRRTNAKFTLMQDAVHPEAAGQAIMAAAVIEDVFGSGAMSEIAITLTGDSSQQTSKTSGGTLADLSYVAGKSISFSFQPDALPWVIPAEGQVGLRLGGNPNRFNRGLIKIAGLAPGAYDVRIDGTVIGTHGAGEFTNGVNIYANGKHPDFQVASTIADLNRTRNAQAVNPMRNLWGSRKSFHNLEAKVKAKQASEKEQKTYASATDGMKSFEKNAAEISERCRNLELQIYKQCTPPVRKFEIVRSSGRAKAATPDPKKVEKKSATN